MGRLPSCRLGGLLQSGTDERQRRSPQASALAVGSSRRLTVHREIETSYPNELEKYLHNLLGFARAENGEIFTLSADELDAAIDEAKSFIHSAVPQSARAEELKSEKPTTRSPNRPTMIVPSTRNFDAPTRDVLLNKGRNSSRPA